MRFPISLARRQKRADELGRRRRSLRLKPSVDPLEQRQLMTISDMTQLAQVFAPHSGPTILYLNFDGGRVSFIDPTSGTTVVHNISSYQPGGNRSANIAAILDGVAKVFQPFNVEVEQMFGSGASDESSFGNTTIFVGDDDSNNTYDSAGTLLRNLAASLTPFAFLDDPGPVKGYTHAPNSDPWDLAFVDPVSNITGSFKVQDIQTIVANVAHEAGHTFGLEHVLTAGPIFQFSTANPPDLMAYDAPNTVPLDQTFAVTDLNYDPKSNSYSNGGDRFYAEWKDLNGVTNKITTQDSFSYLMTALGPHHGEMTMARNSNGNLEAFAIGPGHQLWHEWQWSPGGSWSGWQSLGGYVVQIAVGQNKDGRLEAFGIGNDNHVYHIWQSPYGGWSGWQQLSSLYVRQIAAASNSDGRLEVFAIDAVNGLEDASQTSPGGPWSQWTKEGGYSRQISVGTNADGRLEVFAIGWDGQIYHDWQGTPGGSFSGWNPNTLGGYIYQATDLAVARNSSGPLEVFAIDRYGVPYHSWQTWTSSYSGFSPWNTLGYSFPRLSELTVGQNQNGQLEVFGIDPDGNLEHIRQGGPYGGWGSWTNDVGGGTLYLGGGFTDIALASNADGRIEVFAMRPILSGGLLTDRIFDMWQVSPNGGWSGNWAYNSWSDTWYVN